MGAFTHEDLIAIGDRAMSERVNVARLSEPQLSAMRTLIEHLVGFDDGRRVLMLSYFTQAPSPTIFAAYRERAEEAWLKRWTRGETYGTGNNEFGTLMHEIYEYMLDAATDRADAWMNTVEALSDFSAEEIYKAVMLGAFFNEPLMLPANGSGSTELAHIGDFQKYSLGQRHSIMDHALARFDQLYGHARSTLKSGNIRDRMLLIGVFNKFAQYAGKSIEDLIHAQNALQKEDPKVGVNTRHFILNASGPHCEQYDGCLMPAVAATLDLAAHGMIPNHVLVRQLVPRYVKDAGSQ